MPAMVVTLILYWCALELLPCLFVLSSDITMTRSHLLSMEISFVVVAVCPPSCQVFSAVMFALSWTAFKLRSVRYPSCVALIFRFGFEARQSLSLSGDL